LFMALSRYFKNNKVRVLLIVLGMLVIIRLALPYIVLHYANKMLAGIPGYFGHVQDIDLSLYRGAYKIRDMYLHKKDSATGKLTDFFKVDMVDLSVEWKALLKGELVGELNIGHPSLIFTKDKTELKKVKKDTSDFRRILKNFMPLSINRLEISGGSLHYVDSGSSPKVDVSLKTVNVLATNLHNSYDSAVQLPASVKASASAYEGTLDINMRLNPLAEAATFDLNAELKNTNLVLLNDFLKAYGNFDVNKGNFGLYTELAAKEGKFTGYVKPVIKDLDVVGPEDRKDNFFHTLWEGVVGVAGDIFKNQKKDQIATRIPLEGNFKDPKSDTWEAVWEVLRNAFIQALVPSVDNQISLSSIDKQKEKDDRSLLQKIFSPKDKSNDKKKGKKDRKKR
jgi:hypothetical protein